ncbi:hypothetical protein GCM10011581_38710 [Saccharopolyspora subtropica]|uniref:Uncharacterized protein n=1 Tax=Saccharopolyspora thermophila TaxID=89367 RepID=A0A917NG18_9PSEU|nr:hypothetical protein GCM10011581_38710 [Saccharopolyspora subtropica]
MLPSGAEPKPIRPGSSDVMLTGNLTQLLAGAGRGLMVMSSVVPMPKAPTASAGSTSGMATDLPQITRTDSLQAPTIFARAG